MAIDITLNGTFTLDESVGLQTGGVPDGTEDNDDNDITLATLLSDAAAFHAYLFTDPAGLNLNTADVIGAAESATDLINVTSAGPLSTLGLTDSAGDPFDGTQSSGLFTNDGDEIFFLSDLDSQVVLGMYDSDGDDVLDSVAFAAYMQPDGALDTDVDVQLFSVTFTPIAHGDPADDDEAVDLLSLVHIHATGAQTFNFDDLPSGSNLFGSVADDPAGVGLLVFGRTPVMDSNGKYTNASDVIHTSQGGLFATIGVNNQMFDAGEGAYFTFVNDIDNRYLAGLKPGGLTQTEADDGDNLLYDTLQNSDGGFIGISQIQGNDLAEMKITAFELSSAYKGRALINNRGDTGGDPVTINHVVVYDANGDVLEDSDNADDPANDVIITLNGDGTANIEGLAAGYRVEWGTDGDHNQVLIEGVAGKFDVGSFGLTEGAEQTTSLVDRSFVEDDAPVISPDISDGQVDYVAGDSDTHTLNGSVGTDTDGVYAITAFTASFDLLDVHVIGTVNSDNTEVQYFEDKDGSGDFNTGDILYYTMSLTPAGSYTFTVNNAPEAPALTFNFDNLPSGSNLFGSVADSPDGPGIFVFGRETDLNNATKYTNQSDVIHTSQGGINATIGVNNQMFDTGEGAYFTFADDIRDNFLSGVSGGLTATEADYGKNLLYDDGLHETDGAFLGISQIQAGSLASLKLTTFALTGDPQDTDLLDASGTGAVPIDHVIVYDENGDVVEDSANADDPANDVTITLNVDGTANIAGLDAGYKVEWETSGDHNQVLVEATGGKFDIGFFGLSEPQVIPDHTLDFTVSFTDADQDTVSDMFQVNIDSII